MNDIKKGNTVLYRGEKYKVLSVEKETLINGLDITYVKIKHPTYSLKINSKYVIKC